MAMWQHTCGVNVWRSMWRCKLDFVAYERVKPTYKSKLIRLHPAMCQRHTVLATHSIIKCNAPKTAMWQTFLYTIQSLYYICYLLVVTTKRGRFSHLYTTWR